MSRPEKQELIFTGIAASPGLARGYLHLLAHGEVDVPHYRVEPERQEEEIARFEQGLLKTKREIASIRAEVEEKVGEDEAAIFDAHQLVLEDRALIEDTINEVVNTGMNIEYCLHRVANRYVEAFAQIDDAYIKERAADIRDVTRRLLNNLLGNDSAVTGLPDHPYVLLARDLSPSDAALLNSRQVLAIITELGSFTSHSVIMARSLNIAAVVGVHGLFELAEPGDEVLVDGYQGLVFLNPTAVTLEQYGKLESQKRFLAECFEAERQVPARTADGTEFAIMLNVEGIESVEQLQGSGADGVGLMRTENLFLTARGFPDEEEQFVHYRELAQRMAPHPVTIRTLDLGGDKNPHSSLTDYHEVNPFMGYRGIRFCLENPEVFKQQLRAILRASHYGKVRILYPMICNLDELLRANSLLEEAREELCQAGIPFDGKLQRGAMIEVPSAAVIVDLLAQECEFLSIGTNDLIQYLLAVDRTNDRISYLYDANNPAVMRTLNDIFQKGKALGVPVSVCGELAGDPYYAPVLIGMGASELSMSLGQLSHVKFLVRRVHIDAARRLVDRILRGDSAEAIKRLLTDFYESTMADVLHQSRCQ